MKRISLLQPSLLVFVALLLGCVFAIAQDEEFSRQPGKTTLPSGYIKKVVVFPLDIQRGYDKAAEDSWWKVRETLTDSKRFLVASKRFLVQKDVLQPRSQLKPSDVILLGDMLDSDALLTFSLRTKELTGRAYNRADGSLLWTASIVLHQSIPVEKQLEDVCMKLTRDFIASVPYHGTTILDPLMGHAVFEEGDVHLAKVDVGANSRAAEGDTVQWITIDRQTSAPLFGGGSRITVVAEGEVTKNENGILLIEVKRAKDLTQIQTYSLVRLPKEAEYLSQNYTLTTQTAMQPELRYSPLPPAKPTSEAERPLVAALSSIVSFVGFLLLAF